MPLSASRKRQALEAIEKMEADGVPENEIRAMVSGFKAKYENEGGEDYYAAARAVPKNTTLTESLLPNTLEEARRNPEGGTGLSSLGAGVKDLGKAITSVPKGVLDYGAGKVGQLLGGEDPGTLAQNIASKGGSFVDRLIRDPATGLTLPLGGPADALAAKAIPAGVGIIGKGLSWLGKKIFSGAQQGAAASTIQGQSPAVGGVAGGVLNPLVSGVLHVPAAAGGALRRIGESEILPGAANELRTLVRGQATPLAATNPHGIQLTPSQAAGVTTGVKPAMELTAQTNPYLQDIPAAIAERNRQAIPQAIMAQRGGIPNAPSSPGVVSPAEVGGRIEDAARSAKTRIGQRYQAGQEEALGASGIGDAPLPSRTATEKGRKGFFSKQELLDDVDQALENIGYNDKIGFTGNETASKNAINYIREQKGLLGNAKTTQQLLNQKRRIASDVYADSRSQAPLFQDRDHAVLVGFERMIDDRISNQFDHAAEQGLISPDVAAKAKAIWQQTNSEYAKSRKLLESIDQGTGISAEKVNPEAYMSRIKSVGADNLAQLRDAAAQDATIRPLYGEMQAGFFDNFLKGSLNTKTMEISPEKLLTNWHSMDAKLKEAMMPPNVISEMNEIVDLVGKTRLNNAAVLNPSGTARLNRFTGIFKNPSEAITSLLFRGPIKEYYATGTAPSMASIVNIIDKFQRGTKRTGQVLQDFGGPLSSPMIPRLGIQSSLQLRGDQ